ncbi:MFS general substrate transporter, partial [Aureobasidium melanogenum]
MTDRWEDIQELAPTMNRSPQPKRLSSSNFAIKEALNHTYIEPQPGLERSSSRPRNHFSWAVIVAAALSSAFLFAIDNTITADIQPAIVHDFKEPNKLTWISVAFLLTAAGTNLTWGRLYGNFDQKKLYILTIVIFQVGSAICGGAPTMNALIVGRALCGVGSVGMYIGVLSLLTSLTTIAERPIYLAMCGVVWGVGTVSGPFIGGAFADSSATWRWGFYINFCIGGLFSPVYVFLIPSIDPRPSWSNRQRLLEIDWLGAFLFLSLMLVFVLAVAFGGVEYAWNSGATIALLVLSGALFVVFALQQTFAIMTTANRTIFPIRFLKSREMVILFVQVASAGTITFVPIYFIPLFYQLVHKNSALVAGLRLLPFILLLVAMNMANGVGMGRFGYYMPWFLVGSTLVVVASALLYTITTDTSNGAIYAYTAILGFGCGSFSQAPFSITQALVTPDLGSMALSFISCAQISGAAIGVAISNSVFFNTAQAAIARILPDVDLAAIQSLIIGVGSNFFDTLDPKSQTRVVNSIVDSFDKVFIITITGGALCLVLSLFMDRGKLSLSSVAVGG